MTSWRIWNKFLFSIYCSSNISPSVSLLQFWETERERERETNTEIHSVCNLSHHSGAFTSQGSEEMKRSAGRSWDTYDVRYRRTGPVVLCPLTLRWPLAQQYWLYVHKESSQLTLFSALRTSGKVEAGIVINISEHRVTCIFLFQ